MPFEIQDPQEGRVANIIALQSSNGRAQSVLPSAATLSCAGKVSALHLLGAVAPFGPPGTGNSTTACLVVRCNFEDGTSEEHELVNGKQLATYREKVDVPDRSLPWMPTASRFATSKFR